MTGKNVSQTSEATEVLVGSPEQTVLVGPQQVKCRAMPNGNVVLCFELELEPKYLTAKDKAMLHHTGGTIPIPLPGVTSATVGINIVGPPDGSWQLPSKELRDLARKANLPIVFDPDTNGLKLGTAEDVQVDYNLARRAANS